MTKDKVNILIALIAIALVGIIAIQLLWMKNAIKVQNELFDRSVNEAMIATSQRVETLHEVSVIRSIFGSKAPTYLKYGNNYEQGKKPIVILDSIIHREDNRRPFDFDSILIAMEKQIDAHIEIDTFYNQSTRKGRIRNVNNRMPHRFSVGSERLKNTAGKMFYEVWLNGLDNFNDTSLVNSVLYEELAKRNIVLPFFVCISASDKALLISVDADSIKLMNSEYVVDLFPSSIIGRSETLSIYFPKRKVYVLRVLLVPASLSLLFSFFIVAVFALSIYHIVSQKKISEMKSDFINNMTHEFKTPLATISVATDAIVNEKVISQPNNIRHFASIIKSENQRMNKQVETILQMARLDRNDFDFKFVQVDIHQVLEYAIESLLLQIESRGGCISFSKGANNAVIVADAHHLQNLFRNLIDNANKYSIETPKVNIYTRNENNGVWVAVADKGIGMNRQIQQRVFERFFRETSGNIHNVKGFGLGLSYVKAIVDAHKGQIKVQSEPGKGSIFEVFVPFNLLKLES